MGFRHLRFATPAGAAYEDCQLPGGMSAMMGRSWARHLRFATPAGAALEGGLFRSWRGKA